MAYDEQFRRRVIEYIDSGHTFTEMREAFGVYSQRYYVWKKQLAETGSLKYRHATEYKRKIDKETLLQLVAEHPDWYLQEFADHFKVWPQSVAKRFAKLKITRKKKRSRILKSRKKNV